MNNEEMLIQDNFRRDAADAVVDFYVSHNGKVTEKAAYKFIRADAGAAWAQFDDAVLAKIAKRTLKRLRRVEGEKLA